MHICSSEHNRTLHGYLYIISFFFLFFDIMYGAFLCNDNTRRHKLNKLFTFEIVWNYMTSVYIYIYSLYNVRNRMIIRAANKLLWTPFMVVIGISAID